MIEQPNTIQAIVNPDGRLSLDGLRYFQQAMREIETRLAALEAADTAQDAILADHEIRITALEP